MSGISEDLPVPVWSGLFTLFGIEFKCHVLDSGHRIIEEESMDALVGALQERITDSPLNYDKDISAFNQFISFCQGTGIPHA